MWSADPDEGDVSVPAAMTPVPLPPSLPVLLDDEEDKALMNNTLRRLK
jgi:hypothetical protein